MKNGKDNLMPMQFLISFDKLLKRYEVLAESENAFQAERALKILELQKPYPQLREGFSDISELEKYRDVVNTLIQDCFSEVLTTNEIKAFTLPYDDVIIYTSARFRKIIEQAGPDFKPEIRNQHDGIDYIMAATVILKFHYKVQLDFSRPLYYDIPDAAGVMHVYRIMYNADFIDIIPTERSPKLTQEDIDSLLENPNDLELWQEKIPPHSFIAKGFVISNMFDVTAEHSISEIKSELIASDKRGNDSFMANLQDTFRSFFRIRDLQVGFITYNVKDNLLEKVYGKGIKSFLLQDKNMEKCDKAFCEGCYQKLIE